MNLMDSGHHTSQSVPHLYNGSIKISGSLKMKKINFLIIWNAYKKIPAKDAHSSTNLIMYPG